MKFIIYVKDDDCHNADKKCLLTYNLNFT